MVQELFGKECDTLNIKPLDSYDDMNFRVYIPKEDVYYTFKVTSLHLS